MTGAANRGGSDSVSAGIAVIGLSETFEPGRRDHVDRIMADLSELGLNDLRAPIDLGGGRRTVRGRHDWLFARLTHGVRLLPALSMVPGGLSPAEAGADSILEPDVFLRRLEEFLDEYGQLFDAVEILYPPRGKNGERAFFDRVAPEAVCDLSKGGRTIVLGGLEPSDPDWQALLARPGWPGKIGALGLSHAPSGRENWPRLIESVRRGTANRDGAPDIWITQTGYSTWRHDEYDQVVAFLGVSRAPVGRAYWAGGRDLEPDGAEADRPRACLGLKRSDGTPKLLYRIWSRQGLPGLTELAGLGGAPADRSLAHRRSPAAAVRAANGGGGHALITGGAGFIGTNLADRLLADGRPVMIYDSLARPGTERNLRWLLARYGRRLDVRIADVRNAAALDDALRDADFVVHLAAQVAVTTSVTDPASDFDINLRGTFTLLDRLRRARKPPVLIFTSTNKVYGIMAGLRLRGEEKRYAPAEPAVRAHGLDERRTLDFCSPYGCSKGAADQYVLDFARTYGLPMAVFRMSCIYGPRQLGSEDQGWVAHLLKQALAGDPITIYGDGRQVRDILFVTDLVEALLRARELMPGIAGEAFNIGGGPGNAISLLDLLDTIAELEGRPPEVAFSEWRIGDQKYYVSDTRKFNRIAGWAPRVRTADGIRALHQWLKETGQAADGPAVRA